MAVHRSNFVVVLLLLLLLVMLIRHNTNCWAKETNCSHSVRYRKGFTPPMEFLAVLKYLGVPEDGNTRNMECTEKKRKLFCITYRCLDRGTGYDLFVVNACDRDSQCERPLLKQFCNKTSWYLGACVACDENGCNKRLTEVTVPKPGGGKIEITKEVNENICYHAFRYDFSNMPHADLFNNIVLPLFISKDDGKMIAYNCIAEFGCQTCRCQYPNGADHFVFNACAMPDKERENELKGFCGYPLHLNCTSCFGNECNENRIERVRPKPTLTPPRRKTTKSTTDIATITPFCPHCNQLFCVINKICTQINVTSKRLTAKLSQRFAVRSLGKFGQNCTDIVEKLERTPNQNLSDDLTKSGGTVFMEDYFYFQAEKPVIIITCQQKKKECTWSGGYECVPNVGFNGDVCCSEGFQWKCGSEMSVPELIQFDSVYDQYVQCHLREYTVWHTFLKCLPDTFFCRWKEICEPPSYSPKCPDNPEEVNRLIRFNLDHPGARASDRNPSPWDGTLCPLRL